MDNEKDQLFEQTQQQRNPYLARPEDFVVSKPSEIHDRDLPFDGHRGDSDREYRELLRQGAPSLNKGIDLPTEVDRAGPPHTKTQ